MEALRSSETLGSYETARCQNPEERERPLDRRKNLKSHVCFARASAFVQVTL
jgi:hypothetical protein